MNNITEYRGSRTEIINWFIRRYHFHNYLEIGVYLGENFSNIDIEDKTGVDPYQYGYTTHVMTSDEYFEGTDSMFDIIFIDGLHEAEQCYKDIENSLKHLNPGGVILCHDMNPIYEALINGDEYGRWTGDVYKALLRTTQIPDTDVYLLEDIDYGVGIVTRRHGKNINELTEWNVDFSTWHDIKDKYINVIHFEDLDRLFRSEVITICAIAKCEYDYIYDWVDYHLRLGYDKIVIYDNNDVEGERYDELLSDFIDAGRVEIRDVRGQKAYQQTVYNEYYREGDFDWVSIIDCDEFMTFSNGITSIQQFVKLRTDADFYIIPWVCERAQDLDNKVTHIYDYDNPLPDYVRATNNCFPARLRQWHKCTYRAGVFNDVWLSEHIPQIMEWSAYKGYDESGEWTYSQPVFMKKYYDCNPSNCFIRHYITRDIDTFFYKKYLRGHAGVEGYEGLDGFFADGWLQNLNLYTSINNTLTSKEQEYLIKKGFKLNPTFRPDIHIIIERTTEDDEYYKQLDDIINGIRWATNYELHNIYEDNLGIPSESTRVYTDMSTRLTQQTPLILHIGYPIGSDQTLYLNQLRNGILNVDKLLRVCRYVIFNNERNSIIYYSSDTIRNVQNNLYIEGNTFLTNTRTYNDILNDLNQYRDSLQDTTIEQRYTTLSSVVLNAADLKMWIS